MKIIVIGSVGFIGSHIMDVGKQLGHSMVGFDLSRKSDFPINAANIRPQDIEGYDCVIHAAGVLGTRETMDNPLRAIQGNVCDLIPVLESCRQASVPITYVTLGNNWLNPYSISKNCAADFVNMYRVAHMCQTQTAIVYNVFGPRQKWEPVRKIVPEFMRRIIKGEPIELYDGGNQPVDLVYAPDLALDLIKKAGQTGPHHYGTGKRITVKEAAQLCSNALGMKWDFVSLPPRIGETNHSSVSPYSMPHITPMDEAMKVTADWYLNVFS